MFARNLLLTFLVATSVSTAKADGYLRSETEFSQRMRARIELPAETPLDKLLRAEALRYFKKHEEAWEIYNTLEEKFSSSPMLYCHRAMARLEAGDWEGAKREIAAAEKANPQSAYVFAARGALFQAQARPKESLAQYDEALARNPYMFGLRGRRTLVSWFTKYTLKMTRKEMVEATHKPPVIYDANHFGLRGHWKYEIFQSIIESPRLSAGFPFRLLPPPDSQPEEPKLLKLKLEDQPGKPEDVLEVEVEVEVRPEPWVASLRTLARGDIENGISELTKGRDTFLANKREAIRQFVAKGRDPRKLVEMEKGIKHDLIGIDSCLGAGHAAIGDYGNARDFLSYARGWFEGALQSMNTTDQGDVYQFLTGKGGTFDEKQYEAVSRLKRAGKFDELLGWDHNRSMRHLLETSQEQYLSSIDLALRDIQKRLETPQAAEDFRVLAWRAAIVESQARHALSPRLNELERRARQETLKVATEQLQKQLLQYRKATSLLALDPLTKSVANAENPPRDAEPLRPEPEQLLHFHTQYTLYDAYTKSINHYANDFRDALRYRHGAGVQQDLEKSFEILKSLHSTYEVNFALGEAYEYGWGTPRNLKRAMSCYRDAALKRKKYGSSQLDKEAAALSLAYDERWDWDPTSRVRWEAVARKLESADSSPSPRPGDRPDLEDRTSHLEKKIADPTRCRCVACEYRIMLLKADIVENRKKYDPAKGEELKPKTPLPGEPRVSSTTKPDPVPIETTPNNEDKVASIPLKSLPPPKETPADLDKGTLVGSKWWIEFSSEPDGFYVVTFGEEEVSVRRTNWNKGSRWSLPEDGSIRFELAEGRLKYQGTFITEDEIQGTGTRYKREETWVGRRIKEVKEIPPPPAEKPQDAGKFAGTTWKRIGNNGQYYLTTFHEDFTHSSKTSTFSTSSKASHWDSPDKSTLRFSEGDGSTFFEGRMIDEKTMLIEGAGKYGESTWIARPVPKK